MKKNEKMEKKKLKRKKRKKTKNECPGGKNDCFGLDEFFERLGDELLLIRIDQRLNHGSKKNFEIL
jgi:hypothetical protein